jgi:hypothetical protein
MKLGLLDMDLLRAAEQDYLAIYDLGSRWW